VLRPVHCCDFFSNNGGTVFKSTLSNQSNTTVFIMQKLHVCVRTGYTEKNGAVSKVNKKCISHLTQAQRTPSAAATVQVSHWLPAARFSCLLQGGGASFQDGVTAGKGFEVSRSVITVQPEFCTQFRINHAQNSRCTVITDLDTSKRSTQKTFSCCDAVLETGPAALQ